MIPRMRRLVAGVALKATVKVLRTGVNLPTPISEVIVDVIEKENVDAEQYAEDLEDLNENRQRVQDLARKILAKYEYIDTVRKTHGEEWYEKNAKSLGECWEKAWRVLLIKSWRL